MTSVQLGAETAGRSRAPVPRARLSLVPPPPESPSGSRPNRAVAPVAPLTVRREVVRPGRAALAVGPRPVRVGCAGAGVVGSAGRRAGSHRPAPPLRLTRRGRRLVAALSIAVGIGIAVLAAAVLDGSAGGLRLAGDSSVVVQSGDTLWSIAVTVGPERDTRAVVHAIMAANDLPGVGLVPGQVLQLP
jgi:nucleoid-associated protein YgaU